MDNHGVDPDEIDVRRGRGGAAERGEGPVRLEGICGIGHVRPVADLQRVITGTAVNQHGHRDAAQVLGRRADGDDVVAAAGHDIDLGHGRQVEQPDHAVDVRPEERAFPVDRDGIVRRARLARVTVEREHARGGVVIVEERLQRGGGGDRVAISVSQDPASVSEINRRVSDGVLGFRRSAPWCGSEMWRPP